MVIETFVFLGVYFSIAFISSFFFTSTAYKSLLEKNKAGYDEKDVGEARALELEAIRRKYYAGLARKYGLCFALFWCIVIPIELLLQVISWVGITVNAISISKHDRDFLAKQMDYKTKLILENYEKQQEEQFDKELNS